MRDVAHVRDEFAVQQNVVRAEGSRSVLVTILKNGAVSTLDVVKQIKDLLPTLQAAAPPGMKIDLETLRWARICKQPFWMGQNKLPFRRLLPPRQFALCFCLSFCSRVRPDFFSCPSLWPLFLQSSPPKFCPEPSCL